MTNKQARAVVRALMRDAGKSYIWNNTYKSGASNVKTWFWRDGSNKGFAGDAALIDRIRRVLRAAKVEFEIKTSALGYYGTESLIVYFPKEAK
jgi:hypothetical protein